ncbi:AAA family ATPase [Azospirillum sp. sgz302134]
MTQTQQYVVRDITGLKSFPADFTIAGWPAAGHHKVPAVDRHYVFEKTLTEKLIAFFDQPLTDSMWVFGPKGSGKTTGIEQLAARLNYPVWSFSVSKKTDATDLLGHPVLIKGNSGFQYGPLSAAYKYGGVCIINEAAQLDPYGTAFLHDVMERKPLELVQNDEVIRPHPMFRLFFTANSGGRGDDTGLYQGDERLNSALLDRCRFLKVDYMDPQVEEQVLARKVEDIADIGNGQLITAMVQAANDIRKAYLDGSLPEPMSTRVLIRWGWQLLFNYGAKDAVVEALRTAYSEGFDDGDRQAIEKIVSNRISDEVMQAIGGDTQQAKAA